MPIYMYQCDTCGIRFERQQRISEAPLVDCPECDGHVRRIIQPVGVIFKGSGFYITDNRQVSSPTLKPAKDQPADKADKAEKKDTPAAEPAADKGTAPDKSTATGTGSTETKAD